MARSGRWDCSRPEGRVRTAVPEWLAGDAKWIGAAVTSDVPSSGDVLYDILIRDVGPGYAYQLKKGATSLTEAWDTDPGSSQNHCMLGHTEEWFYRGLDGISCDPAGPGFRKITVKPQLAGDLNATNATYQSPYGGIVSDWRRGAGRVTLNVTIPANTTATVYVPAADAASVTEGGKPAGQAESVKFLRMKNGAAVFAVGSGHYVFQSVRP